MGKGLRLSFPASALWVAVSGSLMAGEGPTLGALGTSADARQTSVEWCSNKTTLKLRIPCTDGLFVLFLFFGTAEDTGVEIQTRTGTETGARLTGTGLADWVWTFTLLLGKAPENQ